MERLIFGQDLFTWKVDIREGEREGEIGLFHLLVHSPLGRNSQDWARLKPSHKQGAGWASHWATTPGPKKEFLMHKPRGAHWVQRERQEEDAEDAWHRR